MAQPKVGFVDNPHAPDIFVSGIAGLYMTGGNVAVTLERHRVNHSTVEGSRQRVVVGRVVLTAAAAQNLVVVLNNFLEANGLSPSEALKAGQTSQ